jgi:hypothetical protein
VLARVLLGSSVVAGAWQPHGSGERNACAAVASWKEDLVEEPERLDRDESALETAERRPGAELYDKTTGLDDAVDTGLAERAATPRRPRRRAVSRLVAALLPHPRVAVGRGSGNLAGAVYGTIVAMAVVFGLGKISASPPRAFWVLVGSGVFFWAAHVYSELLAHRLHGHHPLTRTDVVDVMRREWPLFQATFPLAVPLALGALGVLGGQEARDLAAFVGVATLAVWGGAIAVREGCGGAGVVGAAATNAAVGLSLVALKLALG